MKKHIHIYDAVGVAYPKVRAVLGEHPELLLEGSVRAGVSGAIDATSSLGIEVAGFEVAKEVELHVQPFVDLEGRIPMGRLTIRIEPKDHTAFFPTIDADLEAEPIDERRTMLSLLGIYQPPLGPVGAALDRLGMHHMAETALHRFFEHLVDHVRTAGRAAG